MCLQVGRGEMTNSGDIFRHLTIALLVLCSSMTTHGNPVDGGSIKKRSVSEHQFMHDKGRSIQELQRRIWLNNVMGELHTADSREVAERPLRPWPDRPAVSLLVIKVAANDSNKAAGREENKPGAAKHQNAKKNGRRKKQGKNSKRKAQRGREESRRHVRSSSSRSRDPLPGPRDRPKPLSAGHTR
ncbi:parathyroid hormone-related protein-like [Rhinoraja longicauda]